MKKVLSLMLLLTILTSCWKEAIDEIPEVKAEKTTYQVWTKEDNFLNIYWNIVNSTSKIINPNISWKITFLSCEPWKKVWPQTLISSISPKSKMKTSKLQLILLRFKKSKSIYKEKN